MHGVCRWTFIDTSAQWGAHRPDLFLPFALFHLAALSVFFVQFKWSYVLACFLCYEIRMFFVTAGYHRYFSHRSFKTSRWFQFVIAFLAMSSSQKGVLWWAAHHRHHHRYSDQEEDLHSPTLFGFWWSHVGWIMSDQYNETRFELHWRFREIPGVTLVEQVLSGACLRARHSDVSDRRLGPVRVGILPKYRAAVARNFYHQLAFAHLRKRRFPTTDTSKNNWLLALVTLGEGWHNNHHYFMASARQGFYWWEVDITYYGLKVLSWFRIVRELRKVPDQVLAEGQALDSASA